MGSLKRKDSLARDAKEPEATIDWRTPYAGITPVRFEGCVLSPAGEPGTPVTRGI